MAQNLKLHAVVLRSIPYLEHHRLLTLFSPEKGRLTAVAHGALGAKSQLKAAAVPFASGEYVLSGNKGRLSVTSFAPDENYFGAMQDYDAIAHGSYLCAFADIVVQEEQPNPELYVLLLSSLAYLDAFPENCVNIFNSFLIRMLDCAGYAPQLDQCAVCGATRGSPRFDMYEGGLCCHRCRPQSPLITREQLAFLRDARGGAVSSLEDKSAALLKKLLIDYTHTCLDMELKAASLIV